VAETVEHFAKIIKEETNGEQIVGVFYGYAYEGPYDSVLSGSYALRRLLSSENLDFFSSPNAYVGGRSFGMDWADMIPVDSVKHNGKLAFIECDIRTHLTIAIQDCRPGEFPDDMYRADDGSSLWVGPPTAALSRLALQKCFAHQITKDSAVWWFDMWGGWFADPMLMDALTKMKLLYDAPRAENPLSAEVAFFADEQAYARLFSGSPEMRGVVESRTALGKSGVPFDSLMVEDAEAMLSRYKAAVFPFPIASEAGKTAIALCEKLNIPYLAATPAHPAFTKEELRAFFEKNGIHAYAEGGEVVYLGYGYLGLHSAKSGRKTLRLPRPMQVSAVYGTDFTETVTDKIEFVSEENATALFSIR
jgi:beta-galactosidase